ncbi:hypothetical protein STAS_15917 [Striga asiatica]|uniref:Uncharacterized protein n=1 Tax=Striga asiatica TaxID=4170 RepID=A0A5A7Q371_STRAF|nr:hypothetical protein STAS_15917 [Striga asiatica]
MGVCFSSRSGDRSCHQKPSSNVVSADGVLRQYSLPATAADVLASQALSSESFFLCNSDRLYFGDFIPSLNAGDQLEPAQIYFVLPAEKLQYRLSAADMAALAVKASVALDQINASNRRRKRKTRISPITAGVAGGGFQDRQSNQTVNQNSPMMAVNYNKSNAGKSGMGVTRSGSVRKLTRYSSRRAKLAVRSFRNKLTTIYEGL